MTKDHDEKFNGKLFFVVKMSRPRNQAEAAIIKLRKAFIEQNLVDSNTYESYLNALIKMPAITYVNWPLLAATIAFRQQYKLIYENFDDDIILRYILVLNDDVKTNENLKLKYKVDIIRYYRLLDSFLSQKF